MWKYLNKGISTPLAIAIILILAITVGGVAWWQYGEIEKERAALSEIEIPEKEKPEEEKTIEYIEDGRGIRVLDKEGSTVFEYLIDDFRDWAKENWDDIFEEPPSFGEVREVDPSHFYRFDNTASISPRYNYLAFSVNDYAVLVNISFVGIINLEAREISLVKEENIGGIQDLIWSPDGKYLTYILDTARAQGDYLSVDNIERMEKEFTLSEKELEGYLEKSFSMPFFKNLSWQEDRIYFETRNLENERNIKWSIEKDGTDLKIE